MNAEFSMKPPESLKTDAALRTALLNYFVENATGQELSDWLKDINHDPKGTIEEKRARIRENTNYPGMPPEAFPQQTLYYLEVYSSDHLGRICEDIGINPDGSKEQKWRRIMREVGFREGWLPSLAPFTESSFKVEVVRPFVEWHLIGKRGNYEKDFYPGFIEDMKEIVGDAFVHDQLPVASGNTLKIDFHLGHPQRNGVGIEFKMPANNSDLQRALGQMDQYQTRYEDQLLVVLFPDFLDKSQETLFVDVLNQKKIPVIVK